MGILNFKESYKDRHTKVANISGERQYVDQKIAQYFKDFPPMGYGTCIVKENSSDEWKEVTIERSSSAGG